MIRNLKALGLALVAVFAMGALTASSASAVDHFTNTLKEGKPAVMTGTSHDNKFEITATKAKFECTTSKFAATAFDGSIEATVDPEYTGLPGKTPHGTKCSSSAGEVTIDMNGCHYVLTGNTSVTEDGTDAAVWITCPTGKTIVITGEFGVEVTVPAQTPTAGKGGVIYKNLSGHLGGSAIEVKATATGITEECHPAFACELGGIPAHTNTADYTGTVVVTGYEDKGKQIPITPITEGKQIGVEVS